RFGLIGISGPRRLQVVRAPKGWGLKSILSNGADVTDTLLPFGRDNESLADVEVILTRQITRLSGRVTDATGAAARDRAVVPFASDREDWYPDSRYLQRVQTAADGAYAIDGLPPGDYLVTSIEARQDEGASDWQDPELLDQLTPRAVRVRLLDGERRTVA